MLDPVDVWGACSSYHLVLHCAEYCLVDVTDDSRAHRMLPTDRYKVVL